MQFKILALASFLAVAIALPAAQPGGGKQVSAYIHLYPTDNHLTELVVRSPVPQVSSETPSMSNANGDVVAFSSTEVHQPLKNAGK